MITLKSKLVATLAVFLIASIVLSSYIALTAAAPKEQKEKPIPTQKIYREFTLDATGTAKNSEGVDVTVDISIVCDVNGKMNRVIHIRTQAGGEVTILSIPDNEEEEPKTIAAFSTTKGQGIIVNKHNFIHLNLMMSGQYYGGRSTVWILRGETVGLEASKDKNAALPDTIDVHLVARRVILPIEGYPQQLTGLKLDGTIAFK